MDKYYYFDRQKHISFSKYEKDSIDPKVLLLSNNYKLLELIPRNFVIIINNNSYSFNIDLIKNTSFFIFQLLEEDPEIMQYNLNINDEENTFKKFEQMYLGEFVRFNEDELLFCQKITKMLQIIHCPNFMLVDSLKKCDEHKVNKDISSKFYYENRNESFRVQMNQNDLNNFLNSDDIRNFTIATNKKKYKCSILGIYSSNVLRKILLEDPTVDEYIYDYEDEFEQFQIICDLFNSEEINLTKSNIDSIKEIAEDLQITIFLDQIDNFIINSEKVLHTIEEQQNIIDSIDNLFDLLYNIKEITVEKVKMSIIMSNWSKTEDDVKELVAFILQVIKTDFTLHEHMLELIIQLNQEANESNRIDILLPFLIKQLLNIFDKGNDYNYSHIYHNIRNSLFNKYFKNSNYTDNIVSQIINNSSQHSIVPCYAFIYKLYNKKIISKEDLYNKLRKTDENDIFIKLWFLPELLEIKTDYSFLSNENNNYYINNYCFQKKIEKRIKAFIESIFPYKIDLYKQTRDFGEPFDDITRSLRNDDIDSFQMIVSKLNCDIHKCVVPFNMYENYIINGETNYINYTAAYGSIKCFKYLLLNDCEIDETTFSHAVFGGNIEIIKIVDQIEKSCKNKSMQTDTFCVDKTQEVLLYSNKINQIILAIMKHRNDLFDWILEQKFTDQDQNNIFLTLIDCSIFNGNVHSLLEIFDKRLNSNNEEFYIDAMRKSAINGFYKLTKLMSNFVNIKIKHEFGSCCICFTFFENISIFDLFDKLTNQNCINDCLLYSIKNQITNIAKFIINKLTKDQLNPYFIFEALNYSISLETNDIFYYLMEKIGIIDRKFFIKNRINDKHSYDNSVRSIDSLINKACKCGNVKATKVLTELAIENKIEVDFTESFRYSIASNTLEISKYFIENNLRINYEKISTYIDDLGLINEELFYIIIGKISSEAKENMYSILDQAIKKKNKKLIQILLKENHEYDNELKIAVSTDDLEIVNIILDHYCQPYFINKIDQTGTALTIATSNNNLSIVKKLLSIPGINPNLYDNNGATPLMIAIKNYNIDIFNTIIEFYNEDIQSYKWQIEKAIKNYLILSNKNQDEKVNEKKKNSMLIRISEIKFIDLEPLFNNNTLLTYACSTNNIDLVLQLLKNDDIDVNLYELKYGDTPLIISIKNNNIDIFKILIDHPKININQKNFKNESPLMTAVLKNNKEIIDIILNDEKFNPIESSINHAFFKSTGNVSKQLISSKFSIDVNYKQFDDDNNDWRIDYRSKTTTLIRAVNHNDIEKIDLIFHHPSFNKTKSQFNKAIKESIKYKKPDIFHKLIEIIDDINMIDSNGDNLLCIADYPEIITVIFNDKTFDSKKSDILKAFNKYFSKKKDELNVETLTLLYEYDKQHYNMIDLNRILENGHSYFTETIEYDLYKFLLLNDADLNMPDKFGIFPLQHAINNENEGLIYLLLDSDKIDLNKKISLPIEDEDQNEQNISKDSTYLHLAASKNVYVLRRILNKKYFDVNVTNDLGETPLIIACRFRQKENINCLFEEKNLDYLHHDKSGKTALNIVFPESINFQITDKYQYRDLLLSKL